jgi:hypothetical protein
VLSQLGGEVAESTSCKQRVVVFACG